MMEVVKRLLQSTRIITMIASLIVVMVKNKFPEFPITEADITNLMWIAITVIIGDTIHPVNPEKQPLFKPRSPSV